MARSAHAETVASGPTVGAESAGPPLIGDGRRRTDAPFHTQAVDRTQPFLHINRNALNTPQTSTDPTVVAAAIIVTG